MHMKALTWFVQKQGYYWDSYANSDYLNQYWDENKD